MSCMVAPKYMNWSAGTTPGTSSQPQQGASCAPNQSMAGLVVLYQVFINFVPKQKCCTCISYFDTYYVVLSNILNENYTNT